MPRLKAAVKEAVKAQQAAAAQLSLSLSSSSAVTEAEKDEVKELFSSSPTSTALAVPPSSSSSSAAADDSDDEELVNPLQFPQPLLSLPDIVSSYLSLPHCAADKAKYETDPRWPDYCFLANTGRQQRNVWTLFLQTAQRYSNKRAVLWLDSSGAVQQDWTFGDLVSRVRRVAWWLSTQLRVQQGQRAVLCFAPGLDYFVGFWACLSLGVVAVPVCPPDPFHPVSDVSAKLAGIMDNCQAAVVLSSSEYELAIQAAKAYNAEKREGGGGKEEQKARAKPAFDLYSLQLHCIDRLPNDDRWQSFQFPSAIHSPSGVSLAFLQYTSGSTGAPKGVMVGHVNILFNAINCTLTTRMQKSFESYIDALAVSWLPSFHDMGLIGFHIAPLIFGATVVYFSPLDFLRDPLLWPRVLSDWGRKGHKITTGGPPFALELCAKRLKEAAPSVLASLDLSHLLSVIVGAEPIRLSSLTSFTAAFAPYGFSACSLMPAYGLAENVLHAFSKMENSYPPPTLYVSAEQLRHGRLVECKEGEKGGKWLVSSGEHRSQDPVVWPALPMDGVLLVVKEGGVEADEGEVGELWLYGRSNTAGYWAQPEETAKTFMGRLTCIKSPQHKKLLKKSFVRTGDLGAFHGGQLYVTGRLKEMIIIHGQNHYPHDVEDAVRHSHAAIRPGAVVAVATAAGPAAEGLAVIVELKEKEQQAAGDGGGGAAGGESRARGKLGKREMELAQRMFKQAQRLPVAMRGPAIRGLAKLGAWWTKGGAAAGEQQETRAAGDGQRSNGGSSYSAAELDDVERAIRRAVLRRFGIPRTVLKTSSGKIRRTATAAALQAGALDSSIIRRSGNRSNAASTTPTSSFSTTPSSSSQSQPLQLQLSSSSSPGSSLLSPALASTASADRPALLLSEVKRRLAAILAEELQLEVESVLSLSETFSFDAETTLDEYGLDSLTAMRIAGRLTREFELLVPLSPFMFLSEPTLNGMSAVVLRLYNTRPAALSAADREREMQAGNAAGSSLPAAVSSSAAASALLPCIMGIGCCVPGSGAPQLAIIEVMLTDMQLSAGKQRLFRKIGSTCCIDRRHSVLPSIESVYFGRQGEGNDECIATRNAVYKQEAPKLAVEAATKAVADWAGDKADITHVVAVTCTGVIVPGLEFHVMDRLGLSTSCQRLSIQFMGCFGALSGIKTAKAFAAESPLHVVLLVCCELCSLHMQLDSRVDNLVGSALFADGAAAVIIAQPCGDRQTRALHPRPPLFELHHSSSLIVPNTGELMAWELSNSGMSIGLGREIPSAIYSAIDQFALQLMRGSDEAYAVQYADMRWCLHPGGPMIIQAICDRLGLRQDAPGLQQVWSVLRQYGNMSSATLLFVLHEMRKQSLGGAWVPALAFGPGLNVEGALLRACDGPRQSGSTNAAAAAVPASSASASPAVSSSCLEHTTAATAAAVKSTAVKNNTGLL